MRQAAVVPLPVALALGGCVDSTAPDLSLDVGLTYLAADGAVLIDSELRVLSRDAQSLYQAVGLVGWCAPTSRPASSPTATAGRSISP